MSSEIPALKPKKLIKVLRKIGFEFERQKGSHQIYIKGEHQVIVPYHNMDLKKGTLLDIIKGTGLTV